ncbi:uncharacterized protein Z518_00205 [Rhinocladiella mackenziei CBS 650.93]|uniref:ceramidase n=1 Tax=Rhinocladiella mackenziei CBS 650.93 TaxID=1442369 RepID=A0A0D2G3H5_9EURO|nr:uncharacterized protein Z518_00205 [Rhinocladiella mackenziei CBS 650.93]KIX09127.1 hypothetical protein Z518_00205 [Rhinocladiella mackenziei CBS 650.93]
MGLPNAEQEPSRPPKFTIDLSLNPEDRYKALATAYQTEVRGLTGLFNALLRDIGLPGSYHGLVNGAARLLLRGVHSPIETAELRGISQVTGIPMYLLVSFNVILDALMGCTSGAVKTLEDGQPKSQAKMLHFRTLDWTMDPLRSIIVQLDFVRSRSANPSRVLARSITYVGFVGILTGVRERLSLSLNFRAVHNATTKRDHFRFYFHHLLVLLGIRQSISSILRNYMFSDVPHEKNQPKTLAEVSEELLHRHTTAAYLTFSDGGSTIVIEKDYDSGQIRKSSTFIAATNHDEVEHHPKSNAATPVANEVAGGSSRIAPGLEELLEESRDRLECVASKWTSRVRKVKRQSRREGRTDLHRIEDETTVTEADVIEWVSAYPTTNEQTHLATVLDATNGQVVWTRVYPDPNENAE